MAEKIYGLDLDNLNEQVLQMKKLIKHINLYMDNILVNDKNNDVKQNRMIQLTLIKELAMVICDFEITNF